MTTEIVDGGTPFDPRQAPDPDLSGGIKEREIGGLGLYLIRQFAESIDYARRGEKNFTTFCGRPREYESSVGVRNRFRWN